MERIEPPHGRADLIDYARRQITRGHSLMRRAPSAATIETLDRSADYRSLPTCV
jgi:hypothetical protein